MAQALGLKRREKVFEVGAGSGRFSLHLLNFCISLVALDTSPMLLEEISVHCQQNTSLTTLCASIYDIDKHFSKETFDAVCGFYILHHIENQSKALNLLHYVLRPGGRIGFLEPNRLNPLFLLQVILSPEMKWQAEKGMFTFSATRTIYLLKEAGFEDVRLKRFGFFPPQILDRIPRALDLERFLEKIKLLYRLLSFVLISARKR